YEQRTRICDLGYLRTAYKRADGRIDYRCPAEPVKDWIRKGGAPEEAVGRKCLCNGLMANIDLAQTRDDGLERALLTTGNELANMRPFLGDRESYSADDVIDYLTALVGDRRRDVVYASGSAVSAGAAEVVASKAIAQPPSNRRRLGRSAGHVTRRARHCLQQVRCPRRRSARHAAPP